MSTSVTIPKKALVSLFSALHYPDPDDPDRGWGPLGPLVRVAGPLPDPWKSIKDSNPMPSRAIAAVRYVVATFTERVHLIEAIGGANATKADSIKKQLAMVLDDWCGTPPRRWPFPWPPHPFPWPTPPWPPPPWPWKGSVDPRELVIAGVEFYRAAEFAGKALQDDFQAAGDRLVEFGLKQMSV